MHRWLRLHPQTDRVLRYWYRRCLVDAAGRHDQYRVGGLRRLVSTAVALGVSVPRSLRRFRRFGGRDA